MKNQRVLVVEGEPDLGEVIRCHLERGGFEVTVVSDGLSGLSDIQKHKPDLILINERLDQLSRYEFIREVRDSSESASIPIIAAVKGRTPTGQVLEVGANAVIRVPEDLESLAPTAERLLGSAGTGKK